MDLLQGETEPRFVESEGNPVGLVTKSDLWETMSLLDPRFRGYPVPIGAFIACQILLTVSAA